MLPLYAAVLILLLLLAGFWLMDRRAAAMVRAGSRPITDTPAGVGLPYRDVTLVTADGLKLSGWDVPGQRPEAIILVHGIRGNKGFLLPVAVMLAAAGYPLLLIDLRGHGQSEGRQITYGYLEALDVQAAVDYLLARPGVERVGAVGHSLGGAAVVRAAALDERLGAIVVESSFSSLPEAVADSFGHFTRLPHWPFAPLIIRLAERKLGLRIEDVNSARDLAAMPPRPVLIVHGSEDRLCPVAHAYRLHQAAREPKKLLVLEGLVHDFDWTERPEFRESLLDFFELAFQPAERPAPAA